MTDNTQSEALDLADWLDGCGGLTSKSAAAELRRQHARIADSYASPHHFTLGVNGLRQIIQRALPPAAQQAPAGAWIERWYGSGGKEGYAGWSIVSKDAHWWHILGEASSPMQSRKS